MGVRAHPGFEPYFASAGAAGADLRAYIEDDIVLDPGERRGVATGVFVEIPSDFEGQVRPRSGLSLRTGVTVLNSPGTIDSDYRGEIIVPLINHGSEPVTIERGMRIAQLVITPLVPVAFEIRTRLCPTDRGGGGFGSTGIT
ncbi:MAG: dUTP diphosphatase [Alkalispirochaeta sp.]